MNNIIGRTIKEKREEKQWSQRDFAEKIKVTPQAVSSWESGKAVPRFSTLDSIAAVLNCHVDELINLEASLKADEKEAMSFEISVTTDEIEILKLWRKAPFKTKVEIYQKLSEVNTSQVEEL